MSDQITLSPVSMADLDPVGALVAAVGWPQHDGLLNAQVAFMAGGTPAPRCPLLTLRVTFEAAYLCLRGGLGFSLISENPLPATGWLSACPDAANFDAPRPAGPRSGG